MQISLIFVDTFVKKGLVFLFSHKLNKLRYYSHTHTQEKRRANASNTPPSKKDGSLRFLNWLRLRSSRPRQK